MTQPTKTWISTWRYRFYVWRKMRGLLAAWKQLRPPADVAVATGRMERLVILPADPWELVGSKGDEAMMQAVVSCLKLRQPALAIGIATATNHAREAAMAMGFTPLAAWSTPFVEAVHRIQSFRPDAMILVGADIMDGHYGPVGVARMLLLADLAARQGVRVIILGFSFNRRPSPHLRQIFDGLHRSISVNVRDQLSLERFQAFTSLPANLVADAAFMLEHEQGASLDDVTHWAAQQKAAGQVILGFNIHPMLIRDASERQIEALVQSATAALQRVASSKPISILLIAHDYRGRAGDATCLAPIHERLLPVLGARVCFPQRQFAAAQLKAMTAQTDGVITGRMHLAIAALGMAKPVAGLTYQDKFQGLFAHFAYPERYLMTPEDALDSIKMQAMIESFIDERAVLQKTVGDRLPAVLANAALNLRVFDESALNRPT